MLVRLPPRIRLPAPSRPREVVRSRQIAGSRRCVVWPRPTRRLAVARSLGSGRAQLDQLPDTHVLSNEIGVVLVLTKKMENRWNFPALLLDVLVVHEGTHGLKSFPKWVTVVPFLLEDPGLALRGKMVAPMPMVPSVVIRAVARSVACANSLSLTRTPMPKSMSVVVVTRRSAVAFTRRLTDLWATAPRTLPSS